MKLRFRSHFGWQPFFQALKELDRETSSTARESKRIKAVIGVFEGQSYKQIEENLDVSGRFIRDWKHKAALKLTEIEDRIKKGEKISYLEEARALFTTKRHNTNKITPEKIKEVHELLLRDLKKGDPVRPKWTIDSLRERLIEEKIFEDVSYSTVQRIISDIRDSKDFFDPK